MNESKCPYCGGFLTVKPFYSIERHVGVLSIYICPKCGSKVQKWENKE